MDKRGLTAICVNQLTRGAAWLTLCLAAAACGGVSRGESAYIGGTSAGGSTESGATAGSAGLASTTSGGGAAPKLDCANCDDADCAAPGSCTLLTACALIGCSTASIDETACNRPSCASDDDCAADARCATGRWQGRRQCADVAGVCQCSGAESSAIRQMCSPTALAGTRGAWRSIKVEQLRFSMVDSWQIRADGSVVSETPQAGTRSSQLSAEDLNQLTFMVNGPDLRRLLADDAACGEFNDYNVVVSLELDSGTIKQSVTSCATGSDAREPFPSLLALVQRN